jgi:hypothetical protein
MNRINELAIKAGYVPDVPIDESYMEFDIVKYTRLIVSECSGIYEAIDNGNKMEGTNNYQKAIYKRFGL